MAEIASAFVSLLPSAKGFGSKLNSQVSGEVNSSGKKLGSSFGKMFMAGAAIIGGTAAIGGFLKDSIGEAREAQKVGALTTSTIKATGGAAHVTAQQVGDLAGALSSKTGIDDEVIQSGQNMLLTFKNIRNEAGKGNDIFDQTSKIMVDLSSAMGTEPKQAAIQLGKALNDPVKGISALSRVGVTFSDKQKAVNKALVEGGDANALMALGLVDSTTTFNNLIKQQGGDVAKTVDMLTNKLSPAQKKLYEHYTEGGHAIEAQKVLLKELNSEFGGAAEAQATAGEKAAVALGNLKEQIGTALLPVVDKIATALTTQVIPAISGFVAQMQSGEGVGGHLASVLKVVWTVVSGVFGFLVANKAAVGAFVGILATAAAVTKVWTAAQLLFNIAMTANPIGIVVVAIAALVAGVIYAYKHFDTFRAVVDGTFSFLKSAVTTVINFVKAHWKLILGILLGPVAAAAIAIATHWSQIKGIFSKGIAAVVGFLKALPGKAKAALSALGSAVVGVFTSVFDKARSVVEGGIERVVDTVRSIPGRLRALGGLFANAGHEIISAFVNGLKGAAGLVSDIAGNVWTAVKGFLNDAIRKINAALEFTIHVGPKSFTINPPDIPPMYAKGTNYHPGGLAIVGERGPELVNLPRGSQVFSNKDSMGALHRLRGDDAVLNELREIRKAMSRQAREFGREINRAATAGYRGEVA